MSTTFRTDVAAGLYAVLSTYATANPSLLVRAFRARPASFADLPCAWVDSRDEDITHDSGTRTRSMRPSILVADRMTDNAETAARFDTLVDALVDAFTASPQLGTGGVWSRMTVTDEEIAEDNATFMGARFTFPDISIQEGRI